MDCPAPPAWTCRQRAGRFRSIESDPIDSTHRFCLLILRKPLEVNDIDEALEDLELVLEQTEEVDNLFGKLVVAYEGFEHASESKVEYAGRGAHGS